jgi:hypothetical protein
MKMTDRYRILITVTATMLLLLSVFFAPNAAQAQTCFGLSYDDPQVCSANGACIGQDTCVCYNGWEGALCQSHKISCYGIYYDVPDVCGGNGSCVSYDVCQCNNGWEGNSCSTYKLPTPCTSYTDGAWGACVNGTQTRTVTGYPDGCSGGAVPDATTQACSTPPATPVGYSPQWLMITLLSLTVAGGYLLRKRMARL